MHASVRELWRRFADVQGFEPDAIPFGCWHFSDNAAEADELLALVLAGQKRATAPSLWELGGELPEPGELDVVTNGAGVAGCVIQTVQVDVVPYRDVSAGFAAIEGEGDGSLAHWRRVHWPYYERVLAPLGQVPTQTMPIVCQQFEVVFQ